MGSYTAKDFIRAMPGTGGIVTVLANKVGCDWRTAKKYITEYATVAQAYEAERASIDDKAEHNILKAIMDGDLQMSKWWVQVKKPEFSPKANIDVTSGGEKIGGDDIPDDRRMAAAMAIYERVRARIHAESVDGGSAVDSAE